MNCCGSKDSKNSFVLISFSFGFSLFDFDKSTKFRLNQNCVVGSSSFILLRKRFVHVSFDSSDYKRNLQPPQMN